MHTTFSPPRRQVNVGPDEVPRHVFRVRRRVVRRYLPLRAAVVWGVMKKRAHLIAKIGFVLALFAVLASIAVPNLLKAMNRSHQKRTMADMRSIATAWEARATDRNSYSVGSHHGRLTTAELAAALEPTYIRKLPRMDGWGTEFQLATGDEELAGEAQSYDIRSLGSDGRPDSVADLRAATTKFTDDIIYTNGSFSRYPEETG
jgi:type II secretory pathway pseudopilin PulG